MAKVAKTAIRVGNIFPTTNDLIAIYQLDLVLWLLVAARCYRPAPLRRKGLRSLLVKAFACHAAVWDLNLSGRRLFINAIRQTFFSRRFVGCRS